MRKEIKKVKTVLISSGDGMEVYAALQDYRSGFLPHVSLEGLISTEENAGCLDKARFFRIEAMTVDRKQAANDKDFNDHLGAKLESLGCELVFLVGCTTQIYPINGLPIYNIHPADPREFGGKGMYGVKVHQMVLERALDQIKREKRKLDDEFLTYPTVHEVISSEDNSGNPLMTVAVSIPKNILKSDNLTAATNLQKHVLSYEWIMLSTALEIAAYKILHG